MNINRIIFLLLCTLLHLVTYAQQKAISLNNSVMVADFSQSGITNLSSPEDEFKANIISRGRTWGNINLLYQVGNGDWLAPYSGNTVITQPDNHTIVYTDFKEGTPLKTERVFEIDSTGINWKIRVETAMDFDVTIGDLAISLPISRPGGGNAEQIYEKSFTKHQYIGGNGSYIYFTRPSGNGPFLLVMTRPGTKLEYFDNSNGTFNVYIHSSVASHRQAGTWRQPNTDTTLQGSGRRGSRVEYELRFQWANSYEEMRDILFQNNLIDFRVVPGMTIPINLETKIALRTKNKIDSVVAEFPEQTIIQEISTSLPDQNIYNLRFNKLGENKITVHYNGTEKSVYEFFTTEPIETLIKKRAKFITHQQQHRDSTKWYDGLYSIWDMKDKVLRGPDNTDGFDFWWGYVLAADDPALGKAPFVAAKNVYMPDGKEIESLEYYIKNFVWGGLQRTDKEYPNPYGIYGTPNWHVARSTRLRAEVRDYNLHKMKTWRSYDYPHIFMLYFNMYKIAKFYPEKVHYLNADEYLERAYQTTRAYFTYPFKIMPDAYTTYKHGCYNELLIPAIIDALNEHGKNEEANWLRKEWGKKAKYFILDQKYPFGSEYSFDRTAFESSHALARWAVLNGLKPDKNLWYDKVLEKWYSHPQIDADSVRSFLDRQIRAGLSVRGWLTPAYYSYGADESMSYMARMGGWSVMDYGLYFAEKPFDWIQLGYGSYLSSFSLINTGTEESNYGYWFPGKENDGAMGWAFQSQKFGNIWLQSRTSPRGPWNYDGEADLGNGAIFRTAMTLLTEDPVFGWVAYGGNLKIGNKLMEVIPQDGVNNRFGIITDENKLIVELSRDRISDNIPVITSEDGERMKIKIENTPHTKHELQLRFTGTPEQTYIIKINKKEIKRINLNGGNPVMCTINLPDNGAVMEISKQK